MCRCVYASQVCIKQEANDEIHSVVRRGDGFSERRGNTVGHLGLIYISKV